MRNVNIAAILCEILIDPNSTAVFRICEEEIYEIYLFEKVLSESR